MSGRQCERQAAGAADGGRRRAAAAVRPQSPCALHLPLGRAGLCLVGTVANSCSTKQSPRAPALAAMPVAGVRARRCRHSQFDATRTASKPGPSEQPQFRRVQFAFQTAPFRAW